MDPGVAITRTGPWVQNNIKGWGRGSVVEHWWGLESNPAPQKKLTQNLQRQRKEELGFPFHLVIVLRTAAALDRIR
jgi:hypothetical protein